MDRTPGVLTTAARLLRIKEWVKNVFVFAPLVFSARLLHGPSLWTTMIVFGALCALSSSVYILNDTVDAPRARRHPIKRNRPIASGRVSPAAAGAIAAMLVGLGFALLQAARVPASVWWLAAGFLALNLAYSLYLKHKVIVDVLTIAIGYVIRVLIGGAAVYIYVTNWLLLCTFLLATFLGFSKRRHELAVLGAKSESHRSVLTLYSEEFLDRMSMLTLAMTMTCYVLYTVSPETVHRFGTHKLLYSSVIVMFGFFRYLFLVHVKKMGSPVEAFYYDRQLVLAVIGWMLYVVVVVYTWPAVRPLLFR